MEVLAGARDASHLQALRRLLLRCQLLPVEGLDDYEAAAAIYRDCRSKGGTVRALTDCLIARVAMRSDVELLHSDNDFSTIAQHVELKTVS
jgi:predicted nucleic acid-binding protein